jgi:Skp family chaperone for outer membrane proteins
MTFVLGIVVVGGCLYVGGRLFAQGGLPTAPGGAPAAPAAPLKSRIAVVNLMKVVRNYTKFKTYQSEIAAKKDVFQKQLNEKKNRLQGIQTTLMDPKTPEATKATLEKEGRDLQRQAEDLAADMNKQLAQMNAERMVSIYKDVQEAVRLYARSSDIELVMHYNDGEGQEAYLPGLIQQKVTNNALTPFYVAPGMDISDSISTMLNRQMTGGTPATTPAQVPQR